MKKYISFVCIISSALLAFGDIAVHSHRGEKSLAPENTVEAIKLAYDLGSLMIETDVNLTKEGHLVVMHGKNELKKYWGIDKEVADLTLEDLKNSKLVCPQNFDKKYANVKIPTFDEILKVIPKDKRFELEIKVYGDAFADKAVEAIKRAGLTEKNVLVTCFNPEVIKDFKKKYPNFKTMYICWITKKNGNLSKTAENIIEIAKDAGASEVAIGGYRNIDRQYVKKIQDAGLLVGVWQVENLNDLDFAYQLGANRVCSNYAYELRKAYKRMQELKFK